MPLPNNPEQPHQSDQIIGSELDMYMSQVGLMPGVEQGSIAKIHERSADVHDFAGSLALLAFRSGEEQLKAANVAEAQSILFPKKNKDTSSELPLRYRLYNALILGFSSMSSQYPYGAGSIISSDSFMDMLHERTDKPEEE